MKKIIKTFCLLLTLVLSLFVGLVLSSVETFADKNDESPAGFSYNVNFPENQKNKEVGYFWLKMIPGQEQNISITLNNPTSKPVTVKVELNGAKTNSNGVIEYGETTIKNDPSLKYDFKEQVTAPESVGLKPGETKDLKVAIKMPKTSYDGIILGGIQLTKVDTEEDKEKNNGATVINRYAYVVPMVLQESDRTLAPELKLNRVYPELSNGRNAIFVNFSNVIADFLNDVTIEVQITSRGSSKVLYESKTSSMRMAPNTNITYPVSMNGERMKNGTYTANIVVNSDKNRWEWKEKFEISKQDADKFNEQDVNLEQEKGVNWGLIALIVLSVLVITVLIYNLTRQVKKKRKRKMRSQKKQSGNSKKNG